MAEGMPFECLVDPEARRYRALEIGRVGITEWLRRLSDDFRDRASVASAESLSGHFRRYGAQHLRITSRSA